MKHSSPAEVYTAAEYTSVWPSLICVEICEYHGKADKSDVYVKYSSPDIVQQETHVCMHDFGLAFDCKNDKTGECDISREDDHGGIVQVEACSGCGRREPEVAVD